MTAQPLKQQTYLPEQPEEATEVLSFRMRMSLRAGPSRPRAICLLAPMSTTA